MNIKLHDYQQVAVNFALTHPKCGLFLDLGLGKTLITLAILEQVYNIEQGHILIVAPKSIAKATWAAEIDKWQIKLPYKSLICDEKGHKLTKQQRLIAYQNIFSEPVRTVYFINREMLVDLIDNCPRQGKSIVWPFQTIVVDELQSFKSSKSKRFQAIKTVLPAVNRFIGLTATPIPNGIEDIWSQIYLMDKGERLGKNITAFRMKFMRPGYRSSTGVVCNWLPNNGAEEQIYDLISDITISMKHTNLKLPPIVFVNDYVDLSPEEKRVYSRFMKESVLDLGDDTYASAANAAVLSAKLQQLASGAIYTVDSDGCSTGKYAEIHYAKLERLKYIRENSKDNILVSYFFKSDADMIMKYFTENNLPCEMFDSNKSDEYLRRWNHGEIKTLLIQPSSAGFGLNFQYASHTLVWYTLPFNLENYLQTIGRIYRQGQTDTVYVHRIMTNQTIDEHVLNTLLKKNDTMEEMLAAIECSTNQTDGFNALANALCQTSGGTGITNEDIAYAVNNTLNEFHKSDK